MHEKDQQKADFDRHDERIREKEVRIPVEQLRTQEEHGVPGQVQNQIREEGETGEADEQLGPDRGRKRTADAWTHGVSTDGSDRLYLVDFVARNRTAA
jgi:hypothetical protein